MEAVQTFSFPTYKNNRGSKIFGNFESDFIDDVIAPNLQQKFLELGFIFSRISLNSIISDHINGIFICFCIWLEETNMVMLVDHNIESTTEYIDEFIERLEKLRKYEDLHRKRRTFIGAVADKKMTDNLKDYVLKQGLFVIEPSGEDIIITSPKGQPKEW